MPIPSLLIDGYNLIGIAHQDLKAERERLVSLLIAYRKKKGHAITVVFDGWKGGGKETTLDQGGVKVIYSGLGEKADAVIKRIMTLNRREWVVVSSDRDIMAFAWSVGAVPVPSALFSSLLEHGETAEKPCDEEEREDENTCKKGRAEKLSKKEKTLRRALARL